MANRPFLLYGHPDSRSKLVEHVLAELALDYEQQIIDFRNEEHRTPEFLAINPAGWIPALRCPDGTILTETAAINLTLAERYAARAGQTLAPDASHKERPAFLMLLFHMTSMLEPALKRLWYPSRYAGGSANEASVIADASRDIFSAFALLERRLHAGGPYLLGARFTLVDIMLAYWFRCIAHMPQAADLPHIRASADRVYARPALERFSEDAARMIELWEAGA
ncbi:MAG: glutathione S-transferase family protein [Pseudomonadota bacterium]